MRISIYNFDKVSQKKFYSYKRFFEYVLGMKTIIQLTPEKLIKDPVQKFEGAFLQKQLAAKCFHKQQKQLPRGVLEKGVVQNQHARVSFLIKLLTQDCNFIKKETLAQVISREFCRISKNAFSFRTPPAAASEIGPLDV